MNTMQEEALSRSISLYGASTIDRLNRTHVAIVGLGGVGGSAAAALARCGIGALTLIDGDCIAVSNLNRQIISDLSSLEKPKASTCKNYISTFAPWVNIREVNTFLNESNLQTCLKNVDYVIDAMDSLREKCDLIDYCHTNDLRCISATGAGNRLRIEFLQYGNLFETKYDPFSRAIRHRLRERKYYHPVVFSSEIPNAQVKKGTIASSPFVPNAMGLMLANAVVLTEHGNTEWGRWK